MEKREWIEAAQEKALIYIEGEESRSHASMLDAAKGIPENTSEMRAELLNIYLDVKIGSMVRFAAKYASNSQALEDAVIEGIRYKFAELKKP